MFGDNDLSVFFKDMGVSVSWNGEPAVQGILDTITDLYAHGPGPGGFERQCISLRFPYNAFTAVPAPGDAITVTDLSTGTVTNYTVRELPEQKDMQITEVYLKTAS